MIVIGGGLAGLTAARELAASGWDVLVFEKHPLPHHKVCGEYLSLEVVPYLEGSGVALEDAPRIDTFRLHTTRGNQVTTRLPLGGIGISRYALDYRLFQAAREAGAHFRWEAVEAVAFSEGSFLVQTRGSAYRAAQVLGAWGKRSAMDRVLHRPFFSQPSPWMGIKMHFEAAYPANEVGLYPFRGGYGGLSVTETGAVNFCYLIHRDRFRESAGPMACTRELIQEQPGLRKTLSGAAPLFEKPLSISNLFFGKKQLQSDRVLMAGDAARLIHPLCGNGMAMAIETGRLQARLTGRWLRGEFGEQKDLLREFQTTWEGTFSRRLHTGTRLQGLLTRSGGLEISLWLASRFPGLLRRIIRNTHGSP